MCRCGATCKMLTEWNVQVANESPPLIIGYFHHSDWHQIHSQECRGGAMNESAFSSFLTGWLIANFIVLIILWTSLPNKPPSAEQITLRIKRFLSVFQEHPHPYHHVIEQLEWISAFSHNEVTHSTICFLLKSKRCCILDTMPWCICFSSEWFVYCQTAKDFLWQTPIISCHRIPRMSVQMRIYR